jgi:flagellar biosynthetic protein FlhB
MTDAGGERTEQATQHRMKEVHSKGQLSKSMDLTAWLGVGAAAAALPTVIAESSDVTSALVIELQTVMDDPQPAVATELLGEALSAVVPILTPMFLAVVIAVVIGTGVQGGIHLKKLTMHGENFTLLPGLKRIFGPQAWWEGTKAVLKTAVVGGVLYLVLQGLVPLLMSAGGMPVSAVLDVASGGAGALLQTAIAAGLALAVLDMLVIARRNRKRTRMSKKEVKDESKNHDGDPLVRAHRRSRQLAMSRNRMIAAVGSADVVLLNPTHIAVALKYEPGKSAPRVVAKGAGEVAAKMRERARDAGVPMVHEILLARALHAACDVGEEVPVELYTAVARVLAFVMSLRARGAAQGVHRFAAFAA